MSFTRHKQLSTEALNVFFQYVFPNAKCALFTKTSITATLYNNDTVTIHIDFDGFRITSDKTGDILHVKKTELSLCLVKFIENLYK